MPKNNILKIILDTNLWISFIISNKLRLLDNLIFSNDVRILFSKELIFEIQQTITKPKLKKYFTLNALNDMLESFEPFVDFIEVKSTVNICRDPNDNLLLALAKDGKADFLLTGDKDLLDFVKFEKTKIETITTFLSLMKTYH